MNPANSIKYSGRFDHKLDSKNRVSIPLSWRPEEGEELYLIIKPGDEFDCITALTEERLLELETQALNDEEFSIEERNDYVDWLFSNSVKVSINNQGKLLVPKKMCEHLELNEHVTLIGKNKYFNIWATNAYDTIHTTKTPSVKKFTKKYRM